jgi:hypothetical protein
MKRATWSPIVDDASVPHPGPPMPKKQKSTAFSPTAPGVVPAAVAKGHPKP